MVVFGSSLESFVLGCISRPVTAVTKVKGCAGEANNSCHMFLPRSHISSQESDAIFSPWVRHNHDTFQASNVAPSRTRAYAAGSSLASFGSVLSVWRGRGRGRVTLNPESPGRGAELSDVLGGSDVAKPVPSARYDPEGDTMVGMG